MKDEDEESGTRGGKRKKKIRRIKVLLRFLSLNKGGQGPLLYSKAISPPQELERGKHSEQKFYLEYFKCLISNY